MSRKSGQTEFTAHGEKRIHERVTEHKADAKANSLHAYRHGIKHSETAGPLRKWLDAKYLGNKKGSQMRLYSDRLYVFERNILITVYDLPDEMKKVFEQFIDEAALQRYKQYIGSRKHWKDKRQKGKQEEEYWSKRRAFRNLVLLNDIQSFCQEHDLPVDITQVYTERKRILIKYVPVKRTIPDLSEVSSYVRECTRFKVVQLMHEKDEKGRRKYRKDYSIDTEEAELVYRIEF